MAHNIAAELADLGACAQVSLDADTPEVHDAFRGCEGAWKRAVTGIRRLVAHKVPVSVAAVVTTATIDEIPKLYCSVAGLGVTTFRIMPFVPYGRGSQNRSLEVAPLRMRELMETLIRMKESIGLGLAPMEFECTLSPPLTHLPPGTNQRIGCDGAVVYCTVTANGDVLPCNFFAGVECDNVKEKSFDWIWANSRILNYFRSLLTADIHGPCASCNWLGDCRGSCIAANFTHGDLFQSNCHCWLASEPKSVEMTNLEVKNNSFR